MVEMWLVEVEYLGGFEGGGGDGGDFKGGGVVEKMVV